MPQWLPLFIFSGTIGSGTFCAFFFSRGRNVLAVLPVLVELPVPLYDFLADSVAEADAEADALADSEVVTGRKPHRAELSASGRISARKQSVLQPRRHR